MEHSAHACSTVSLLAACSCCGRINLFRVQAIKNICFPMYPETLQDLKVENMYHACPSHHKTLAPWFKLWDSNDGVSVLFSPV